jgi:SSS family solute:Na+ symporter
VGVSTITVFAGIFAFASLLSLGATRLWRPDGVPTIETWALGGRGFRTAATWFLLGGAIYAVPGLVYGVGALGMFALAYTIVVYPIALIILPRLGRSPSATAV